jgi:hypothetical protein
MCLPPPHLRTETDPVSKTLSFLVFGILDEGQSPDPVILSTFFNLRCNIHTHSNDLSYLGHFQEAPQARPALLSSPQQSNETCQQPTLWTNDPLLARSCSVSGETLHPVMTTETLLRTVTGSSQPTNRASCTIIH